MLKFLFPRARLYVCHYKYVYCTYGLTTNTMPTRIVRARAHLFLTLPPQRKPLTIETESERERNCTQKIIKDKYTLFISTRATLLQRYLSAYNKDVASNKVATLRSVQSRIVLYFVCVIGEQQKSTTANSVYQPLLAFYSVLVRRAGRNCRIGRAILSHWSFFSW